MNITQALENNIVKLGYAIITSNSSTSGMKLSVPLIRCFNWRNLLR